MQTVTIEGYLASDVTILTAQGSGASRASMRVLETTKFKRGDGEQGERTTAFNCIDFREKVADNYLGLYGKKGSRIIVTGHVENDVWTDKDGGKHFDLKLIVSDVALKNRRGAERQDQAEGRPERKQAANDGTATRGYGQPRESFPADPDDQIPF